MRLKVWALAAMAALATVLPARADLVLDLVEVPAINSAFSNGPAITSLNMVVGTPKFIQVSLRDTTPGATSLASVGFPANFAFDARFAGLFGLGFRLDYFAGIVVNPPPPNTGVNLRVVDSGIFQPLGQTNTGTQLFASVGLQFDPGPPTDPTFQNRVPIYNIRLNALAPTAGVTLTFNDFSPGGDSALGDVTDSLNPLVIDSILFGPLHPSFPLNVVVTGVPEPSSMILAGVALSGLGMRLRRKKAAAAV